MSATPNQKLLLKFRSDAAHAVSRKTVKKMAKLLGFNETETTLFALARLRDQLVPPYEPDDGPLTGRQLAAIRKIVPQGKMKVAKSLM